MDKLLTILFEKIAGSATGKSLVLVIAGVYVVSMFFGIKQCNQMSSWEKEKNDLIKKINSLEPLEKINQNLYSKLAEKESDLSDLIEDTSYLKKLIKNQDERIKLIATVTQENEVKDFEIQLIPIERVIDTLKHLTKIISYIDTNFKSDETNRHPVIRVKEKRFDSTEKWFAVKGVVDDKKIRFEQIKFIDSLKFIFIQKSDDWYKGYIQSVNPYSTIKRFDINIEFEKKTDWLLLGGGVLGGAAIAVILIKIL